MGQRPMTETLYLHGRKYNNDLLEGSNEHIPDPHRDQERSPFPFEVCRDWAKRLAHHCGVRWENVEGVDPRSFCVRVGEEPPLKSNCWVVKEDFEDDSYVFIEGYDQSTRLVNTAYNTLQNLPRFAGGQSVYVSVQVCQPFQSYLDTRLHVPHETHHQRVACENHEPEVCVNTCPVPQVDPEPVIQDRVDHPIFGSIHIERSVYGGHILRAYRNGALYLQATDYKANLVRIARQHNIQGID